MGSHLSVMSDVHLAAHCMKDTPFLVQGVRSSVYINFKRAYGNNILCKNMINFLKIPV